MPKKWTANDAPLSLEAVAPGRSVKSPEGRKWDVTDVVTTGTGSRYLVLNDPENTDAPELRSEDQVRAHYQERDPEEVFQEREDRASETDVTDETDSQGSSSSRSRSSSKSSSKSSSASPRGRKVG